MPMAVLNVLATYDCKQGHFVKGRVTPVNDELADALEETGYFTIRRKGEAAQPKKKGKVTIVKKTKSDEAGEDDSEEEEGSGSDEPAVSV